MRSCVGEEGCGSNGHGDPIQCSWGISSPVSYRMDSEYRKKVLKGELKEFVGKQLFEVQKIPSRDGDRKV